MGLYGHARITSMTIKQASDENKIDVTAEVQSFVLGCGKTSATATASVWIDDNPTLDTIQLRFLYAVGQGFSLNQTALNHLKAVGIGGPTISQPATDGK